MDRDRDRDRERETVSMRECVFECMWCAYVNVCECAHAHMCACVNEYTSALDLLISLCKEHT